MSDQIISGSSPSQEPICVLHVDDDPDHLRFTKLFLEQEDAALRISSLSSPEETLTRLEEQRFDCVLLDYLMAEIDGIELARRIRETSTIPIIVYTGHGTEEVASQAFAVGVDDYLRKELDPSHYKVLARRIRGAVERHSAGELIRYLNKALRAIRRVNQLIVREKDRDRLLRGVCETLVDTGSYRDAWVIPLNEDEEPVFTSDVGMTNALGRIVERVRDGEPPTCVERALEHPGVHVISLPDTVCADCLLVDRCVDGNVLTCQLGHGDKVYGVLKVTVPSERVGEDEKALFEEAAGDISFALHAIKLEEERRQAERAVHEAREYAESIVDTVREPLIVLDADLRVVSANRSFYTTFRVTPEETEGRLVYELGNRQWDIPELRRLLEEILTEDTTFSDYMVEHDFPYIGRRVMLLNARRLYREANKTQMILLTIEDLTERKRMENRLEALHEHATRLINCETIEEVGELTFNAIEQTLGFNIGSFAIVEGDLLRHLLIRGVDVEEPYEMPLDGPGITVRAVRTGKTQIVPDTRMDGDFVPGPAEGVYESLSELAVPVKINGETVAVINVESTQLNAFTGEDQRFLEIFAIHVASALSRLRRVEELKRLIEEKTRDFLNAERLASAGRVASMITHDLRGPLQTIKNAVHLIRRAPDETEAMLKTIDNAVKTAAGMLDALRYRIQEAPLKTEATNLARLLRKVVDEAALHPSIKVALNLGEGLESVSLDPSRMIRVLDNLIRNAVEAMPQGGELTISAVGEEDGVVIRVRDTGVGIPEELMPNLFKPFYTTKPMGWGLGLAYCKQAVEAHGGSIRAESVVGKGTTFTIVLPRNMGDEKN